MTEDRLLGFERAVGTEVEFMYRVAAALTGDSDRAEEAVFATLADAARSWRGEVTDRGRLLGMLYRRLSESDAGLAESAPAIHSLPRRYRDVVILASLPTVRTQDVATALDISKETVRTRRRRAFALMYRRGGEGNR